MTFATSVGGKKQLRSSRPSKSLGFFWCQLEDVIIEVRWFLFQTFFIQLLCMKNDSFEYSNAV